MAATTLENYPTQEAARMRLAKLELAEPVVAVVEQPDGTLAGGSLVESARALVKAGLAEDAVSVLAQSLSRRGAAWWACRVARLEAGGAPAPKELRALAAFLAGESIAPPHLDPLPPLPHLAGMAAAGGVKLAAARRAPAEPKQELLRLINAGFAIASGTDTWEGS
jgi:hypothetical protein